MCDVTPRECLDFLTSEQIVEQIVEPKQLSDLECHFLDPTWAGWSTILISPFKKNCLIIVFVWSQCDGANIEQRQAMVATKTKETNRQQCFIWEITKEYWARRKQIRSVPYPR